MGNKLFKALLNAVGEYKAATPSPYLGGRLGWGLTQKVINMKKQLQII